MLRTDLISLINGRKMWAFVGSGASMEAGCPGWRKLVEDTVMQLTSSDGQDRTVKIIENDRCVCKIVVCQEITLLHPSHCEMLSWAWINDEYHDICIGEN